MALKNLNGQNLILLTAVISGVSIFLNSYAVKGFDSSVFTFAKNIVVAVLLFCIIILYKNFNYIKKLDWKEWTQLSLIGLVGGSIPFLLFFRGLQLTTGSAASFLQKTIFVYALILGIVFLKEKLEWKNVMGTILLLIGTYFMVRPDIKLSDGIILVLISVIFWSVEYLLSKKLLSKASKDISGNIVAWGRMFFGSFFILLFLFATGKSSMIWSMNLGQYYWIIISSVLLLLYVITFYNGLKGTTLIKATAILTLGGPVTVILSWMMNGYVVTLFDALGIILTLLGVLLIAYYGSLVRLVVGERVGE